LIIAGFTLPKTGYLHSISISVIESIRDSGLI
jgi:hypothetical protein